MRTCLTAERKLELLEVYMANKIEWLATQLEHGSPETFHKYLFAMFGTRLSHYDTMRIWNGFPTFEQFLVRYEIREVRYSMPVAPDEAYSMV